MNMPVVREVMTEDVVTVTPSMTVETVASLLRKKMISGAPVTDAEGNLVGVVSTSDLGEQVQPHTEVGDIMTRLVIDVDEEADLRKVADLMLSFRIHRVIVTREKKVVGLVSCLDLLRELRDLL